VQTLGKAMAWSMRCGCKTLDSLIPYSKNEVNFQYWEILAGSIHNSIKSLKDAVWGNVGFIYFVHI